MDIGYRWSGSVNIVLHFGGRRIERLDLGTRVPASLLLFCTSEELISRVI